MCWSRPPRNIMFFRLFFCRARRECAHLRRREQRWRHMVGKASGRHVGGVMNALPPTTRKTMKAQAVGYWICTVAIGLSFFVGRGRRPVAPIVCTRGYDPPGLSGLLHDHPGLLESLGRSRDSAASL